MPQCHRSPLSVSGRYAESIPASLLSAGVDAHKIRAPGLREGKYLGPVNRRVIGLRVTPKQYRAGRNEL